MPDTLTVYRAYTRSLNQFGRVKDIDFKLRDSEDTLSVALTPEKAMGTLDCKGVVPLRVQDIRELGRTFGQYLDVVVKGRETNPTNDPELLEVIGIPHDPAARISLSEEFGKIAGAPEPKIKPKTQ